jgi:predicted nucleotidyltransferase
MLPVPLPDERQPILDQIVDRFKSVRGIQALVLGGSFARGVARIDSDLDIGIYYAETDSPDLEAIRDLAAQISVPDKLPTVTGLPTAS